MNDRRRANLWDRFVVGCGTRLGLALGWLLLSAVAVRAELQFDVFLGFDDHVREGHWFPVAFEIHNDGPTFTGTVHLAPEGGIDTQVRSFAIELPTGTRKRVVIPVFSAAGRYARWEARLLDPAGKILAERSGIQPKDAAFQMPILGALPRTFGGLPKFPEPKGRAPEFQAAVARLQTEYLPTTPIPFEALTSIYLNSEKAGELKPEHVEALLGWIHEGGHLIVALEQPGDVNGIPWLRALLPFAPEGLVTRHLEGSFERWLVSGKRVLQLPSVVRRPPAAAATRRTNRAGAVTVQTVAPAEGRDPFTTITPHNEFNNAELGIVTGRALDGETLLRLGDTPLIQSAPRGRGTVTVLAFSPEREPMHSWKNLPWFWAKLAGVPPDLLSENSQIRDAMSIDGIFGAMLDSRQVRKLPVTALLLLLVVYLVVIGPFDQWILKRTGRQMWTWVTFPLYVVLFSGLIYFIGYRLRAGDLEWNEMQVVDQLPRGDTAAWRGRTWASLYSPANARYRLTSEQYAATLRAEFQAGAMARSESGRLNLRHPARGFDAEAYVPVWINQLYTSDWMDAGPVLLSATVESSRGAHRIVVRNVSALNFQELQVAISNRLYSLGPVAPGAQLERDLAPDGGTDLDDALSELAGMISVVDQRRFAFGSEHAGQLPRGLKGVVQASFAQRALAGTLETFGRGFASPSTFDVTPLLLRGDAVLFGWAPEQALAPPIYRFTPTRVRRDTVVRVDVPVTVTR